MIDALFNQTNYVATKKLLDATVLRHEAIASNLTSADLPGYKRLDVNPNFSTQLSQAMQSSEPGSIENLQPALTVDSTAIAQGRDGNTVQLEKELIAMQQNVAAHALETQLVSGQMMRLRLAITGRST